MPMEFTSAQINEIRRMLGEKENADRVLQRKLRKNLRQIGFYISNFYHVVPPQPEGFRLHHFEELINNEEIIEI